MTVATRTRRVDGERLVSRVVALRRFIEIVDGTVPAERLAPARTVLERSGQRLSLSGDHTVVALAGATGSGKSSLFNKIAGLPLSPVGVRRPTTGVAHSCTWGSAEPTRPLLDWLGVPTGQRFTRESALDGDDEAALRGLVLLDLPDFDSVEEEHRVEVDRLLNLVDLMVWVLDPQKYADKVVHERYFAKFAHHREITVVLLNQSDRLAVTDVERVAADLRRLLDAGGMTGVPLLPTSAVGVPGTADLRAMLERTVTARQAALHRLSADLNVAAEGLIPLVAVPASRAEIDRGSVRRLTDALADAAGVPAVVEATEQAYRHRASKLTGWPLVQWMRRMRPDPLRRLHIEGGSDQPARAAVSGVLPRRRRATIEVVAPTPATSLPGSTAAEKAAVALAGRSIAERAAAGGTVSQLPDPWPAALAAAARSRLDDVPDALDVAIARTDLGLAEQKLWWRVVGGLQWFGALVALAGLVWLGVRFAMSVLGLPDLPTPKVGILLLPTALLFGGLLFGVLLAIVVRPFLRLGAKRARRSADRKLRNAVSNVAMEMIVTPVRETLRRYAEARDALAAAGPQ
jgi:energy-coupling factor transporter ATP-binding protein EcfA2